MEKDRSRTQYENRSSDNENCMSLPGNEYCQQNSESSSKKIDSKSYRKLTKTEENASHKTGTISSESSKTLDDSGLSILSHSDVEDDTQLEDNSLSKKTNSEEDGKYEELVCLVRQFYVEKPINPAALAHQNIETC